MLLVRGLVGLVAVPGDGVVLSESLGLKVLTKLPQALVPTWEGADFYLAVIDLPPGISPEVLLAAAEFENLVGGLLHVEGAPLANPAGVVLQLELRGRAAPSQPRCSWCHRLLIHGDLPRRGRSSRPEVHSMAATTTRRVASGMHWIPKGVTARHLGTRGLRHCTCRLGHWAHTYHTGTRGAGAGSRSGRERVGRRRHGMQRAVGV